MSAIKHVLSCSWFVCRALVSFSFRFELTSVCCCSMLPITIVHYRMSLFKEIFRFLFLVLRFFSNYFFNFEGVLQFLNWRLVVFSLYFVILEVTDESQFACAFLLLICLWSSCITLVAIWANRRLALCADNNTCPLRVANYSCSPLSVTIQGVHFFSVASYCLFNFQRVCAILSWQLVLFSSIFVVSKVTGETHLACAFLFFDLLVELL